MGRLILLALVIVTVIVVWKAFGPSTWTRGGGRDRTGDTGRTGLTGWTGPDGPLGRGIARSLGRGATGGRGTAHPSGASGPDDDPDFLWRIERDRFKARREAERAEP